MGTMPLNLNRISSVTGRLVRGLSQGLDQGPEVDEAVQDLDRIIIVEQRDLDRRLDIANDARLEVDRPQENAAIEAESEHDMKEIDTLDLEVSREAYQQIASEPVITKVITNDLPMANRNRRLIIKKMVLTITSLNRKKSKRNQNQQMSKRLIIHITTMLVEVVGRTRPQGVTSEVDDQRVVPEVEVAVAAENVKKA